MKHTGCFDVLHLRATGNSEMVNYVLLICVYQREVDWWVRNPQC